MRIAVVLHDFELGGAERIALRLANHWADLGADVTVLSGAAQGPQRAVLSPRVKVVCAEPRIARGPTRSGLARFCAERLPALAPEVVFLPGNYYFGLARPIKAAVPGVRIAGKISNGMDRAGENPLRAAFRLGLLRLKSRWLDRIVLAHDSFAPEVVAALGGRRDRYVSAGQPVLDALPALSGAHNVDPGALIAAGRLVPQKNFGLAIEALALLPDCTLTIYGEGPLRDALVTKAQSAGVAERVRFAGFRADLSEAFAQARLFVLSSDYEGFGTVVVEALAHGVPVVATDCSASIRAFFPDPALGTAVPPRDAAALAKAIAAQLARPRPDAGHLRGSLGDYMLGDVARRYLGIFEDMRR